MESNSHTWVDLTALLLQYDDGAWAIYDADGCRVQLYQSDDDEDILEVRDGFRQPLYFDIDWDNLPESVEFDVSVSAVGVCPDFRELKINCILTADGTKSYRFQTLRSGDNIIKKKSLLEMFQSELLTSLLIKDTEVELWFGDSKYVVGVKYDDTYTGTLPSHRVSLLPVESLTIMKIVKDTNSVEVIFRNPWLGRRRSSWVLVFKFADSDNKTYEYTLNRSSFD